MATKYMSPFRAYKFILNSTYETWITTNYTAGTGWGLQDGLFWTDRDEPTYKISTFGTQHGNDGFAWTSFTHERYAENDDGTRGIFIDSYQTTTRLTSGDVIMQFVPVAVGGGNQPAIDDGLYATAFEVIPIDYTQIHQVGLTIYSATNTGMNALSDNPLTYTGAYIDIYLSADTDYKIDHINKMIFNITYTDKDNGGTKVISVSIQDYPLFVTATYGGNWHIQIKLSGLQDVQHDYTNVYGVLAVGIDTNGQVKKSATNVTLNGTNVSFSNTSTTTQNGQPYTNVLSGATGYTLDDSSVRVYMGGVDITSSVYTSATHTVNITTVTGDIGIYAESIKNTAITIKTYDGLTTYYTNIFTTKISKFKINVVSGVVYYIIDGTTVNYHTIPTITGKQFVGLSISASSDVPLIFKNSTYQINGDLTLYECYRDESEVPTTFDLYLFTNGSPKDEVRKDLTSVGTLSGSLREECSVINPIIKVETANILYFNYVYIPIFKRYYYVTGTRVIRKGLWELSLKVDVLMTYADLIYQQEAYVTRNEYQYDEDKIDTYVNYSYDKTIESIIITPVLNLFDDDDLYNQKRFVMKVVSSDAGS